MIQQQGDVILKQTPEGGEIIVESGLVAMDGGIVTMVYLCLFGGNEHDDGRENNPKQYWGNRDEVDTSRQYRSETQHLLRNIATTSGNLLRIEEAMKRDLQVFLDEGIATNLETSASITGINKIQLDVTLLALGEEQTISFTENWKATTV